MNSRFLDIVIAKDYQSNLNGSAERRTAWNKVGRAWLSRSGEALNVELFMLPNQRYVIQFNNKSNEQKSGPQSEMAPF
jgi:hypothetical protein